MVFQSYSFLFLFLPVLLGVIWLGRYLGHESYQTLLILAGSMIFYASWGLQYLPFVVLSALCNYGFHRAIVGAKRKDNIRQAARIVTAGICTNLGFLMLVKYQGTISGLFGTVLAPQSQYFPIGISFITFIQIAYLVESYVHDDVKTSAASYFAFSTFFPYITSGPIASARETIPQFQTAALRHLTFETFSAAMMLFAIGLFKKLAIADTLAPHANKVFAAAAAGQSLTAADAWGGALAYTFQLYFDFSGYCDMAVALGFLFGIRLPLNFNSPFRATTVVEYWQRWHMTLTKFITNYLYMPLAVYLMRATSDVKHEQVRFLISTAVPIVTVFVVAGIWHGNGWIYVLYGLYWGIALAAYHWSCTVTDKCLPKPLGQICTIAVAVLALVIFRSEDVAALRSMIGAMSHFQTSGQPLLFGATQWAMLAGLVALVLYFPNSQQIVSKTALSLDEVDPMAYAWHERLVWHPTRTGAVVLCGLLLIAALLAGGPSQFLYYKF